MTEHNWQKSSYSETASSCVYLAATPTGGILLRESDEPDTVLRTSRHRLGMLIRAVRDRHQPTTG
ncbi:hypothetical protein GCM10010145_06580 [Streptomyces ruber]|uniref:DUF397 domain-containing protein n=2 Tax=Streptomyces TaxID=1883 RepID=A0A918B7A9_9ACTN|nr:DUF397 domain-containing protein [Streptomyces ruber]GGQ41091.1 hypothetical protein GCM10010145_06580 [Streptomyces ruber]